MVYIVAYDLKKPNNSPEQYEKVEAAIKSLGGWAHIEKSVWLVSTQTLTVSQVRDSVFKSMITSDKLFVARLAGDWGSYYMDPEVVKWLKEANFLG